MSADACKHEAFLRKAATVGLDALAPQAGIDERRREIDSLLVDLDDPQERLFGDYELIQFLGRGGMGVVYRARQRSLDRDVALKMLVDGDWADIERVRELEAEAKAAGKMHHPNIVEIFDAGVEQGVHYFAMRLVQGPSLAEVLARKPMELPQAVETVRKIAEAVHYAHELDVLHLDLKPGNILLSGETPLVTDFGLARSASVPAPSAPAVVAGTPEYMAPEQASGALVHPTRATDVHALGAILYEAITGHSPFAGNGLSAILQRVLQAHPTRPRVLKGSFGRDLWAILSKCLEKVPGNRYQTARELADDLGRLTRHELVSARSVGIAERLLRFLRGEPALAAAGALALSAGLIAFWQTWERAQELESSMQLAALLVDGTKPGAWDRSGLEAVRAWRPLAGAAAGAEDRILMDLYRRAVVAGRGREAWPLLGAWSGTDSGARTLAEAMEDAAMSIGASTPVARRWRDIDRVALGLSVGALLSIPAEQRAQRYPVEEPQSRFWPPSLYELPTPEDVLLAGVACERLGHALPKDHMPELCRNEGLREALLSQATFNGVALVVAAGLPDAPTDLLGDWLQAHGPPARWREPGLGWLADARSLVEWIGQASSHRMPEISDLVETSRLGWLVAGEAWAYSTAINYQPLLKACAVATVDGLQAAYLRLAEQLLESEQGPASVIAAAKIYEVHEPAGDAAELAKRRVAEVRWQDSQSLSTRLLLQAQLPPIGLLRGGIGEMRLLDRVASEVGLTGYREGLPDRQ